LTLKSRVALREGTWNKFHHNSNYQNHLQLARDAALQVLQSNHYQLYSAFGLNSYRQLFKRNAQGPSNTETIWALPYGISSQINVRENNYASLTTQGWCGITKSLVDAFLCIDGLPIEKSPLYQGRVSAFSEFTNRDPRLNGTVVKAGDTYITGVPFVPNLTSGTGYAINKYFDQEGSAAVDRYIDLILMRYGEVLLNYAEAVFEMNENISDQDLNISINLLRDRVGLPHLTNAFVTDNNLNMRTEIRRERRVELGMEGFRYDDLLRWKMAEIELPKPMLGVKLFPNEYPGVLDPSIVNVTEDGIVIVEPSDKRSFKAPQQYLWPLPLNQLALNPSLTQNPGW
jgi:starch-binding outer membrane protein, SusD/RagB family